MTTLFGTALAVTLALLLIVWLGPRVVLWIMHWYMGRVIKMVNDFHARRQAHHEEMRAGLEALQQAMRQRQADQ